MEDSKDENDILYIDFRVDYVLGVPTSSKSTVRY